MGGRTDGQRHPRTDRLREMDRWTGTGRDGQTEVLAESGVRKMERLRRHSVSEEKDGERLRNRKR